MSDTTNANKNLCFLSFAILLIAQNNIAKKHANQEPRARIYTFVRIGYFLQSGYSTMIPQTDSQSRQRTKQHGHHQRIQFLEYNLFQGCVLPVKHTHDKKEYRHDPTIRPRRMNAQNMPRHYNEHCQSSCFIYIINPFLIHVTQFYV